MSTPTTWDFLTLDEAARIVRIGKRIAHDLAHKGHLGGASKIDGTWRPLKDEFDKWIRHGGGASVTR